MKFSVSLKKNYEFRRTYSKGRSTGTHVLVVYVRKNRLKLNRIGITVTTKVGGAVVRNLLRRRIREIYRLNEEKLFSGLDIVIVARVKSRYVSYKELERAFLLACGKLNIVRNNAGPADVL